MRTVYVISHNRPQNVTATEEKLKGFNVVWHVGFEEENDYRKLGAEQVFETGNLVYSRNMAISKARAKNEDCIMIDDDLDSIKLAQSKNNKNNLDITFEDAVEYMLNASKEIPMAKLIGVASTDNAFYYNPNKPYSLNHFIGGWFMIIKQGNELLFDKRFKLKEDYDYTLQHIQRYGCVLRCDQILTHFKHYGNKGGCVDYRHDDLEYDMVQLLKEKWGNTIKDNPRRKNKHEILLRVKK